MKKAYLLLIGLAFLGAVYTASPAQSFHPQPGPFSEAPSTRNHGQSCGNHLYQALAAPVEPERKPLENGASGTRMPITNVNAYTQSIHNVVAKWQGGPVYRFNFGTAPGLGDIYAGHLLNTGERHTGGHSFPELQAYAAAQNTTFNLGDTFYLNLFETNVSAPLSYPMAFAWENLGNPANNVTIQVETNYGVGGVGPFSVAQAQKILDFYTLVNPIVKEVYGPPSRNHTVYVVNDAFATGVNVYYNGPNQISTSYNLNADGDLDQPRLMVHELVHAYRDNVTLSSDAEWHYDPQLSGFEEGMAEAVAIIVMDIFIERYPNFFNGDGFKIHWNHSRGMAFEWDYDFQNHPQITTENFFSTDIATGSHWLRYGLGAAAMRKLYIEDSLFFRNFNAEYYSRLNNNHALLPNRTLLVDVAQTVKASAERTPMATWMNDQRILDCSINLGKKVFMLSFTQSNWASFQHDNRFFCLETHQNGYEWRWNSSDQAGLNEVPDNGPNNDFAWTHQMNQTPGALTFRRDWDNSVFRTKGIVAGSHWINEAPNGLPAYIGIPLLGPYQGPNPYYVGPVFTRDHEQDNCTTVPGCGRRAWAIGSQNLYTSTSNATGFWPPLVSQGGTIPNQRAELNMNESGLYRFEVGFNDSQGPQVTETYHRMLGDSFVDAQGVYGGIYSDLSDQVQGRLLIEHEDFGPEDDLALFNNSFIADRQWASILETDPNRQGGRNDRRYAVPGQVHAIYLDSACVRRKIDFRTIGFGDGLDGTEMMLFKVEDFDDILFTESNDTIISAGQNFILGVSNNFPDIFSGDPRVTYSWLDPNGSPISTDTVYTYQNATASDSGTYILQIDFMGCPVINKDVHVTVLDPLAVDHLEFTASLIDKGHVQLDWSTQREEAVDFFQVERRKSTGNWEPILQVEALGNESQGATYQEFDLQPYSNTSYYRLKVTDLNGAVAYSNIEIIHLEKDGDIQIYPNPANNDLYINVSLEKDAQVGVFNLLGQKLEVPMFRTDTKIRLATASLAAGSYILQIQVDGKLVQSQIVIER